MAKRYDVVGGVTGVPVYQSMVVGQLHYPIHLGLDQE